MTVSASDNTRPTWTPAVGIVGFLAFLTAWAVLEGPWRMLNDIVGVRGVYVAVVNETPPTGTPGALPGPLATAIDFTPDASPLTGHITSVPAAAQATIAVTEVLVIASTLASLVALYRLLAVVRPQPPGPWKRLVARSLTLRNLLFTTAAAWTLEYFLTMFVLRAAVPEDLSTIWIVPATSSVTCVIVAILGWALSHLLSAVARLHLRSIELEENHEELTSHNTAPSAESEGLVRAGRADAPRSHRLVTRRMIGGPS